MLIYGRVGGMRVFSKSVGPFRSFALFLLFALQRCVLKNRTMRDCSTNGSIAGWIGKLLSGQQIGEDYDEISICLQN